MSYILTEMPKQNNNGVSHYNYINQHTLYIRNKFPFYPFDFSK